MTQKTFLTPEGKKLLEERLDELKTILRPAAAKKVGFAREYGDLSENAEYDSAKEEQSAIETEILEIEAKLLSVVILSRSSIDTSKVSVGCFVKLYDEEFDETFEYQIVGSTESNPAKGFVSNESPVGKSLLGSKKGDLVTVQTPAGVSKLKVLGIRA
ncbi:MAG: transcription elongation factor GreA [Clostridia bacterium]